MTRCPQIHPNSEQCILQEGHPLPHELNQLTVWQDIFYIHPDSWDELVKHQKQLKFQCIACKYSGIDEEQYRAHGCPSCICGGK